MQPLFGGPGAIGSSSVRCPTLFNSLCRCATIGRCDYAIRSLLVSHRACAGAAPWGCGGNSSGPLAASQRALDRSWRWSLSQPPPCYLLALQFQPVVPTFGRPWQPLLQSAINLFWISDSWNYYVSGLILAAGWTGYPARPQPACDRRPVCSPWRHAQRKPGGAGGQPPVCQQRQPVDSNAFLGISGPRHSAARRHRTHPERRREWTAAAQQRGAYPELARSAAPPHWLAPCRRSRAGTGIRHRDPATGNALPYAPGICHPRGCLPIPSLAAPTHAQQAQPVRAPARPHGAGALWPMAVWLDVSVGRGGAYPGAAGADPVGANAVGNCDCRLDGGRSAALCHFRSDRIRRRGRAGRWSGLQPRTVRHVLGNDSLCPWAAACGS